MHPSLSRTSFATIAFAVIVAAAPVARAQPRARASDDPATRLYGEGVALADAGNWSEAVARFRQVVAIRPVPKAFFTLGQAEEKVGRPASAATAYRSARAGATDPKVAKAAEEALAAVEPKVPSVRIVVTASVPAAASIDGAAVTVGDAVALDPGEHRLSVQAAAMRPYAAQLKLAEGEHLVFPVVLVPISSPASAIAPPGSSPANTERESASSERRSSPLKPLAVVAGGLAFVGVGVGIGLAQEALSKKHASDSQGCNGDSCNAKGTEIRNQARAFGDAATVAFVSAGVFAAGGVALWLVAPAKRAGVGLSTLRITPEVSAQHVGCAASARF